MSKEEPKEERREDCGCHLFTEEEQKRLGEFCKQLSQKIGDVIREEVLSKKDENGDIEELYAIAAHDACIHMLCWSAEINEIPIENLLIQLEQFFRHRNGTIDQMQPYWPEKCEHGSN